MLDSSHAPGPTRSFLTANGDAPCGSVISWLIRESRSFGENFFFWDIQSRHRAFLPWKRNHSVALSEGLGASFGHTRELARERQTIDNSYAVFIIYGQTFSWLYIIFHVGVPKLIVCIPRSVTSLRWASVLVNGFLQYFEHKIVNWYCRLSR